MPVALEFKPRGFKLKSIFSLLPWSFSGRSSEEDDRIRMFIIKAQEIEDKMAEIRIRLEKRSEELYRKVVAALRQGDRKKAEVYAAEIVHLKKLLKFIKALELLAIRAIERVKTTNDARELSETLLAFSAALDEVREQMKGLYPSLAIMYNEVAKNVKLMVMETMPPDVTDIDVEVVAREASRMLEEVLREAEQEVERILPSTAIEEVLGEKVQVVKKKGFIPASSVGRSEAGSQEKSESRKSSKAGVSRQQEQANAPVAPRRQAARASEAVAAGGRARREGRGSRYTQEELERILLDYILTHGGFLDLSDFTKRYGVAKEDVLAALHRLHAKGLIRLA